MIKHTCWQQAQKILSEYRPAVQAVVMRLLKRRTLEGSEVHRIIWQTIGYPDADWRLQAMNRKQGGTQGYTLPCHMTYPIERKALGFQP